MAAMPARYVSARYVGREDAFGRLAAVLDDAAHGRARAMLVSGPAGVGISRFFDEATARIGRAERADDGPPRRRHAGRHGRAVRTAGAGHRAGARGASGRRARRGARPGGGRAGPAAAAAAGAAGGRRPVVRRDPTRGAGAPPGPDHGGRARDARTAGRAPPRRPDPRGPAPRRCRDPGTRDVPRPDRRRPAARARRLGPAGHHPARRPVGRRGGDHHGRVASAGASLDAAARPRRTGRADRGDRGRADVGEPAAARRRAVRRQPARRGGAAGRPPRAADRVALRLPRRARRRPAGHPLGRVPPRAPAARAGRPHDGPGAAGPDRGRFRDRHVAAGAAVDQPRPAAGTGSSTRT